MGCYVHRNPTALQENDFILHGSYALAHSCCIPLCVKRPPFIMYRSLYFWLIRSEAIDSRFRWHFARSGCRCDHLANRSMQPSQHAIPSRFSSLSIFKQALCTRVRVYIVPYSLTLRDGAENRKSWPRDQFRSNQ